MSTVVTFDFENPNVLFPLSSRVLSLLKEGAQNESLWYTLKFLGRERVDLEEIKVMAYERRDGTGLVLAVYLSGLRQRFKLTCNPVCSAWLKMMMPRMLKDENICYVYGYVPARIYLR